jgi:hypothetical protein
MIGKYGRMALRKILKKSGDIYHGSRSQDRKDRGSQESYGHHQEHGLPEVRQGHTYRETSERP